MVFIFLIVTAYIIKLIWNDDTLYRALGYDFNDYFYVDTVWLCSKQIY